MTVLFADAVESTPLAEKLGEEEMYSLIRECLSRQSEAVHRYEGHVATFTGDGLMALFGAPIAHEDSARRAVAAALRMQGSLRDYAREVEQRHGVECRFRVGLNTGPVVVGTVSDDLQMDFTAIGDTVNLAARMEQAAGPGAILVSESTHRVVGDFFECHALGEIAVKGKTVPVRAWRVLREKQARTRFEAAAERGLSRLVGRDRELELLESHVEQACQGAGQVVLVSGEAGIGKSRLILELRRRPAGESMGWWEGHCVSYGRNSPYLPVVDLLKAAFGIEEGDDDAWIIRRVDNVVSCWEERVRQRAPYLKYLLSVDPGDEAVTSMDPQERRIEIFAALRTLFLEESRRRPLVVVVEDLHWADQMSQEALSALVADAPSTPLLLVLSQRPGYAPSLGERADVAHLDLDQLDEEESVALTRGVLGVEALPPEIQGLITARAEGNPFYIEEVSKALVEAGVVARVDGSYQLRRPVEEIHIPGTISEVILSRIDRLEREAKQAIQLASVIGREFTARLLDRISDLEGTLSEALGELKALDFIFEKAYFPELAYMFKHALTHDVAYATLLGERRRALHRLVGGAIEELYGDRMAEHYETLAHHYFEGQDWEKALDYLNKAGDKAAAAYANHDALGFYARALEVCETQLPPGVERDEQELALRIALGAPLVALRGYGAPATRDNYARADELSVRLERPSGAPVLRGLALASITVCEFDQALELGHRILELAESEDDPRLVVEGHYVLGVTMFWRGELAASQHHLEQAIARYGSEDHQAYVSLFAQDPKVICLSRLALALWHLGRLGDSARAIEESVALGESLGHPLSLAYALTYAAWLSCEQREMERTEEFAQPLAALCADRGLTFFGGVAEMLLGWVEARRGRPEAGIGRIADGLARSTPLHRTYGLFLLAQAHALAGQLGTALGMLREALEATEQTGQRYLEAELYRLRGELLLAEAGERADTGEAEEALRRALEVAHRQGAKILELRAAVSMARWRTASGPPEKAAEALRILEQVSGAFPEAAHTADLEQARELLHRPT